MGKPAFQTDWKKHLLPTLPGIFAVALPFIAGAWIFTDGLMQSDFLPHQYCFGGDKRLVWANALADSSIGLSYMVISVALGWLARRSGRKLPFVRLFWLFGTFIISCGMLHFLEVLTIWRPYYWLSTAAKIATGLASIVTAGVVLVYSREILEFVLGQADIATLRGNEQFRAVVEAAPMAVMAVDRQGLVTSWNPSAERIFGWKQSEMLGTRAKTVPAELREELFELFDRSLQGDTIRGFESLRINRGGEFFPVSISMAPLYDESLNINGIVATVEDIRERKRVERELKEKSATLTSVTQALNAFLDTGDWGAASQHLLSFALQKTHSEFGFLGAVLEGPVLRVLAHQGIVWDEKLNRELYEAKMRQHAEQGFFELPHQHNVFGEVIYKAKTVVFNGPFSDPRAGGIPAGHPAMHSFLGVPIFKGSEIVGLIAVANRPGGYTEGDLRSLEEVGQATGVLYDNYRQSLKRAELEAQSSRLESEFRQSQKMEVLGKLAGGVAHDFNNMLMVLTGAAELLQESLTGNPAAAAYLDQIRRTVDRAAGITKQLLAFSRKQLLEVKPVDLHAVLTDSEFMLPRLLGSDVELTFQHKAARSWMLADPSSLEQVIANLAINARDAMPEGGKLTITTRNAERLPADSGMNDASNVPADWVVLEVRDTGCGMDESTRVHMFEPFFTTKPIGKGTGLGLSTVYGIVHQFGGYIHLETRPAVGTAFQLFFPVISAAATVRPAAPRRQDRSADAAKLTILLADDETGIRQLIADYLRAAGHHVLDSHSALEVLEIARRQEGHIDVLLTDVVMPELRGPELARRVAELHPEIQIIYMSGYAPGLLDSPIPADANFLQKPFRFASLLEQLKLMPRKV